MIYELIAIVRPGRLVEVKEIVKTAGALVLERRGVIRGLTNWGTFLLPRSLSRHGVKHDTGHYFIMRFDGSARTQHAVKRTLSLDPRLLRYSIIRMAAKLEDSVDIGGKAEWGEEPSRL